MKQKKNDALGMFKNFNSIKKPTVNKADIKKEAEEESSAVEVEEVKEVEEFTAQDTDIPEENVTEKKEAPAAENGKIVNIKMKKGRKKEKKSQRTFYMKDSLFEKLRDRAEDNGAGISEYLGFILEQVL